VGETRPVGETRSVDRAAEDARRWVGTLGPAWVASFDQMAMDVRRWAADLDVDPLSYEFRAAWCVATTFLHRMARLMQDDDPLEADHTTWMANILGAVGLWGAAITL
jgi:hypothetical protein